MVLQSKALAGAILSRAWAVLVLMTVNLAGAAYGFYWYAGLFADTPWYLWLFTPDSPLAASLFVLMLLLRLSGRPAPWLEAISFLGLIKFGAWTVLVTGYHLLTGGAATLDQFLVIALHLAMVAQGAVFLPLLKPARGLWLTAFTWFVLHDFMDYAFGPPYLPNVAQVTEAMLFALVTTVLVMLYALRLRPVNRPPLNYRYSIR